MTVTLFTYISQYQHFPCLQVMKHSWTISDVESGGMGSGDSSTGLGGRRPVTEREEAKSSITGCTPTGSPH